MATSRVFIAALIGVCVLSAAIGSGITLLAKTGPAGAPGKRGPTGAQGPEGPEGSSEEGVRYLESEVSELQERVSNAEDLEGAVSEDESNISYLESELLQLNSVISEICLELRLGC